MQVFNKDAAKKTFVYTWYLYPIGIILTIILLLWGFGSFHQPTNHQKINIFIGAQVTNQKYEKLIKEKYDREKLREIKTNSIHPSNDLYYDKLLLYLSDSDLLILPKDTFEGFRNQYQNYFFPISQEMKDEYLSSSYTYYSDFDDGLTYGILLKSNAVSTWLSEYMTFIEGDYYLAFSTSSKNLGKYMEAENEYYDNALTIVKYIMEGV